MNLGTIIEKRLVRDHLLFHHLKQRYERNSSFRLFPTPLVETPHNRDN